MLRRANLGSLLLALVGFLLAVVGFSVTAPITAEASFCEQQTCIGGGCWVNELETQCQSHLIPCEAEPCV